MCMILICVCLCFAHREESTATIRERSGTFLTPLWLFQLVMDYSKYKYCVYMTFYMCGCLCFLANTTASVFPGLGSCSHLSIRSI